MKPTGNIPLLAALEILPHDIFVLSLGGVTWWASSRFFGVCNNNSLIRLSFSDLGFITTFDCHGPGDFEGSEEVSEDVYYALFTFAIALFSIMPLSLIC